MSIDAIDPQTRVEMLEEYKTLRAEILMHIDHKRKGFGAGIAVAMAILNFAISNGQPFLCLLAWLLQFYFWWSSNDDDSAIMKLGRYIAVFIEPHLTGVRWEQRVAAADRLAPEHVSLLVSPSCWIRFLSQLTFPYAVLSLACILTGIVVNFYKWLPHHTGAPLVVSVLSVVPIHSVVVILFSRNGALEKRNGWQKAFNSVREAESHG